ncbi:MAG: hypothetical protein JO022_12420 [Acidobacteriaceae bacterium]|nr:hypothetical protein [Acidobacteriaceae bacterium]
MLQNYNKKSIVAVISGYCIEVRLNKIPKENREADQTYGGVQQEVTARAPQSLM